ncbi:MAG: hypothetical protein ACXQS8_08985 [Candidatus Helarchaeales archaeon]
MVTEKDSLIRYSFSEMMKEMVMDFMDILNRFEDYAKSKKTDPNGMILLDWFFDKLQKNAALAANIGKGEFLQEAERLIEQARSNFNYTTHSFKEVIPKLREALTKITTAGAHASEKIF